jgi:hypothetical protein
MSEQSSAAIASAHSVLAVPFATDRTFDARWLAWIERGRAHDLDTRRNVRRAAMGLAIVTLLAAATYGVVSGL